MTVIDPVRTRCPAELVSAIRTATERRADWQRTAELVAGQLRMHLPPPDILTAAERAGDDLRRYRALDRKRRQRDRKRDPPHAIGRARIVAGRAGQIPGDSHRHR